MLKSDVKNSESEEKLAEPFVSALKKVIKSHCIKISLPSAIQHIGMSKGFGLI